MKLLRYTTRRHYGSALYITGEKAIESCPVVSPHVDFEEFLDDYNQHKLNIQKRNSPIRIDKLKESLEFFLSVDESKRLLERRKILISEALTEAFSSSASQDVDKLKIHSKIVKEDLKSLKAALWPIEEQIAIRILSLPNRLHPDTPELPETILTNGPYDESKNSKDHLEIGRDLDLLAFTTPYNYYLKNDAAIFELQAKFYISDALRRLGYLQFSNPDFAKSAIVEGCGYDHRSSSDVFILHHDEDTKVNEDSRLHLTGGGSVFPFAAYHARNVLHPSKLPLRYYTLGRQYRPVDETSTLGLYDVSQASVVEAFVLTKDDDIGHAEELKKVTDEVVSLYRSIELPFRVCRLSAEELHPWESARISFQIYSGHHGRFFEVGNVSSSDNYITKRLQCVYNENNRSYFPRIISGTLLNVPRLLGFYLESSTSKFEYPKKLTSAFNVY